MQVKLRGNRVGIEKLKKRSNKGETFLVMPDEDVIGIIRYVGDSASKDLQVGQKVYFTNDYQRTSINGAEILVLEDKHVLAVVGDESQETNSKT